MPLKSCHQPEVFSEEMEYVTFSSIVGKFKMSIQISRSIFFFCGYEKPGTFCIPNQILHDDGTELFKTSKSGTVVRKPG
jgi:hypothetical protein